MTTLAFEGRITCDNGRESFEIVGEGGDPSIHIGSIRIARRIARDFGPLFRSLPGLAGRQPVLLHIGPRLRARLVWLGAWAGLWVCTTASAMWIAAKI